MVSLERESEWESARWLSRAGGRDEPERGPKASEARAAGTGGRFRNAHSGCFVQNRLRGPERIWEDELGAPGVLRARDGGDLHPGNGSGDTERCTDRLKLEFGARHNPFTQGTQSLGNRPHVLCPRSGNRGSKGMRDRVAGDWGPV